MGYLGNCCCGCEIHEDDFNREDGDTLRGKWCEAEDTYGIDTNRAICIEPEALAILNVRHPNQVGSMSVSYRTIDEEPRAGDYAGGGQRYRILVNLDKDSTGDPEVCSSNFYYFAEYERLGGAVGQVNYSWLRLGVVSAGVESILKQRQLTVQETGLTRMFTATIDDEWFCAQIGNVTVGGGISIANPGLHTDGYYCGFSLSEEDMLIDDFLFQKHFNSFPPQTRDLNCPRCGGCVCEDNVADNDDVFVLPPCLNVRIYIEDPCDLFAKLGTCEFEICYDDIDLGWIHDDPECCAGFDIRFFCTSAYGIERYRLSIFGSCGTFTNQEAAEYECDEDTNSGTWTYGPFCIQGTNIACATACSEIYPPTFPTTCCYYVEVTT